MECLAGSHAQLVANILKNQRLNLCKFSNPSRIEVEVTDLETKITTVYHSLSQAGKALNCSHKIISQYISRNQQTPYRPPLPCCGEAAGGGGKGRYIIKKIL